MARESGIILTLDFFRKWFLMKKSGLLSHKG
jgi:hypothetical protein